MSRKWYVVHTLSGCENKVRTRLEKRIDSLGIRDSISKILIPTEEIAEVRGGEKKVTTRNLFPGYVLVEMEMNEETWYLLKSIPGVSGFLGSGREPVALEEKEIESILKAAEEKRAKPKPKAVFEPGERVRVMEGPLANLSGVVEELNPEKGRLKVMVSIFGRSTPVELEYWQVESI